MNEPKFEQRLIVFDIRGSYAYFRRPYTTTSATSYPFPCRSNIEGLVAAILGIESSAYPETFISSRIAISLLNNVSKMPFSLTYTHSDFWNNIARYLRTGSTLPYIRAPRRIELLREPKYRLYFSTNDSKLMDELGSKLENHEAVYPPYLGSNNMLANFELIDANAKAQALPMQEEESYVSVSSIVPFRQRIPKILIQKDIPYAVEHDMPAHITSDRELTYSYSAIYSPLGGKEVLVSKIQTHKVIYNGDKCTNIVFIPALGPTS